MNNMSKTLLVALACLTIANCGGNGGVYRISAPDSIGAGKTSGVAVSGSFEPGARIVWTATAGHIEGANNGLNATFVAPEVGSATLLCTIILPGGKTVTVDRLIAVSNTTDAIAIPFSAPPGRGAPNVVPPASPGPMEIESAGFIPSGWMGDIGGLNVDPNSMDNPHSPPKCQKWSYKPSPRGGSGWAAVAWQFPEGNWGERAGKDWSGRGFRQVSIWARGVKDSSGVLPKLQFKAGGGTASGKPYQASFEVQGDFVALTENWRQYTLDLTGQSLKQVLAALVVVIKAQDVGPKGATFYLDDIEYH